MSDTETKCSFCYIRKVPEHRVTCGDNECLHKHLELCKFRAALRKQYGELWNTAELQRDFTVIGFGYGVCVVERKADSRRGSLDFTHSPRFYHSFLEG